MISQKNTWINREIMRSLSNKSNNYTLERWGEGTKLLLTADKLDTFVMRIQRNFWQIMVVCVLLRFSPSVTNTVQPIDVAYGQPILFLIGRILDNWLIEKNNLAVWETGLTVCEHCAFISLSYITNEKDDNFKSNKLTVNCLRWYGFISILKSTNAELIRPYDYTKLLGIIPDIDNLTNKGVSTPDLIIEPELWNTSIAGNDT